MIFEVQSINLRYCSPGLLEPFTEPAKGGASGFERLVGLIPFTRSRYCFIASFSIWGILLHLPVVLTPVGPLDRMCRLSQIIECGSGPVFGNAELSVDHSTVPGSGAG